MKCEGPGYLPQRANSDRIHEFFNDKAAQIHIFILAKASLPVDDHLNGQFPPDGFGTRSGNCLVKGIGMQAITIMIDHKKVLQDCPDIIELDILTVQRAAGGVILIR